MESPIIPIGPYPPSLSRAFPLLSLLRWWWGGMGWSGGVGWSGVLHSLFLHPLHHPQHTQNCICPLPTTPPTPPHTTQPIPSFLSSLSCFYHLYHLSSTFIILFIIFIISFIVFIIFLSCSSYCSLSFSSCVLHLSSFFIIENPPNKRRRSIMNNSGLNSRALDISGDHYCIIYEHTLITPPRTLVASYSPFLTAERGGPSFTG